VTVKAISRFLHSGAPFGLQSTVTFHIIIVTVRFEFNSNQTFSGAAFRRCIQALHSGCIQALHSGCIQAAFRRCIQAH